MSKFELFDHESELWKHYLQRFNNFAALNDYDDNKKKLALLHYIGRQNYTLLTSLVSPDRPEDKTFAEICEALSGHFEPKRNIPAERYRFRSRGQKQDENFDDWKADLQRLSETCEFGNLRDEFVRDQIIEKTRCAKLRERLLLERDLDLEKTVQIARDFERAACETNLMSKGPAGEKIAPVNSTQQKKTGGATSTTTTRGPQTTTRMRRCYRCNDPAHIANTCPFKDHECTACHKMGHHERACRSTTRRANNVQLESEPEEEVVHIYHVHSLEEKSDEPLYKVMSIDGQDVKFQLDTGSPVTVMSQKDLKKYFPRSQNKLVKNRVKLVDWNGNDMKYMGTLFVKVCQEPNSYYMMPIHIVENQGQALLGRDWISKFKLIKVNAVIGKGCDGKSEDQDRANCGKGAEKQPGNADPDVAKLLEEFSDVFEGMDCANNIKCRFRLKEGAKPVFRAARRVPEALLKSVESELEKMERDGIIEKVDHSEWASPLVVAPKPNNGVRLCADYKSTLNPQILVDHHPLPRPSELYEKFKGCTLFAQLDLSQAYLQVPVHADDQEMTTINTHKGLYKFKRLPFGIASAPAIFQRFLEHVLKRIPNVCNYLDDILVAARDKKQLLATLRLVFETLRKFNLKLKYEKCTFLEASVKYVGNILDKDGIRPIQSKIQPIIDAESPKDADKLRSWLGFAQHYHQYIPHLADIAAPLYDLIKQGVKWEWSNIHEDAFLRLKKAFMRIGQLRTYDPKLPLHLECDASPCGLGAVLSQTDDIGETLPVSLGSAKLSDAEKHYTQIEREALAIVWAVTHFHYYTFGRKFDLITDNKALSFIFHEHKEIPQMSALRIQRWAIKLLMYDYNIIHRPASKMLHVDALSRVISPNTSYVFAQPDHESLDLQMSDWTKIGIHQLQLIDFSAIGSHQSEDPTLHLVEQYATTGWPKNVPKSIEPYYRLRNELSIVDEKLFRGDRLVIPTACQPAVLEELHAGHQGAVRMKDRARSSIWWPKMDEDIEKHNARCDDCQAWKKLPPAEEPASIPPPSQPWSRVHVDIADVPLQNDSRRLLFIVDAFSKWMEVFILHSVNSAACIDALRECFARSGIPDHVVTDNGPQFRSEEMTAFLQKNGVHHTLTTPYHPQSNGQAERMIGPLKRAIKSDAKKLKLKEAIDRFLLAYRSTPSATTGKTPASLYYGREISTRITKMAKQGTGSGLSFDTKKPTRKFVVGEEVWVTQPTFDVKWKKATVHSQWGYKTYKVQTEDGQLYRVHVDMMRKRIGGESTDQTGCPAYLMSPTTTTQDAQRPTQRAVPDQGNLRRSARATRPPERLGV